MKSKSWKKEWLVIKHEDYDNTWSAMTIPLTSNQAVRFVVDGGYLHRHIKGSIKIVTLTEFANMGVTA